MHFKNTKRSSSARTVSLATRRQEDISEGASFSSPFSRDIWPEAIDELEAFEYSISDAGNVKTGAPAGIHDDIVMALALATWTPGRFDPNAKVDPRVLQSMLGKRLKPRRARFRIG